MMYYRETPRKPAPVYECVRRKDIAYAAGNTISRR